MIQFQSESPCLNNVNFGWESLVAQKVEKQIKSEVGADCCTEPNGISGPWGPLHPLPVFLLYFQWKWTALRFPTGDYTRRVGVCLKGKTDAEFEHSLTKKTQTHRHTWTSAIPGEWTLKHATVISTILTTTQQSLYGNLQYRESQVKNNRRNEWKKWKEEHISEGWGWKETVVICFQSSTANNVFKSG